ncbi:peptidylprolyl isomerase [Erythrobacter litoralis]|uniref:peptidylprolyl isomerase n=1 Tax=Erythrobacter litoralis TaxID=39960 RepID=UPI002434CD38|nr:peptidylprolyl isomerase [Erythrobacter litoralis]MDG6078406.1 peptidylprolyl isomerase [Erythrobacter litoralis]
MLKSSLALAAAALAVTAPIAAMAQDAETVETVRPTYAPINYDVASDRENVLLLDLSNGQRVAIRLMPSWAPNHVERIKQLTRQGFYDGIIFHRVIDGFMAQTGDPTGTGQGGSSLPDLAEEFNPMPHVRGTVAMARAASEDSANSQFFIVFYPRFSLDKRYTNFGRVIAGMDAVDAINRGEPPADPTRIVQASIASDNRPVPAVTAPQPQREMTVDDLNAPIG